MKKTCLLIFWFTAWCFAVHAQNCGDTFLGTKTLYKAPLLKYTAPPAGYVPVFINHVGRHGARHLTKEVKTTLAYALLFKADSTNGLTEKGRKLKAMVIALQAIERGNTGFISEEGKEELRALGGRMFENYGNVFKDKTRLSVTITKEIRTKQSADAFLHGMNGKLKDSAAVDLKKNDTQLRFYSLSPAYKSFEKGVDKSSLFMGLEKDHNLAALNKNLILRFFEPDFLGKLDEDQQSKFVSDVFGFVNIVYSLNAEIKKAGYSLVDLNFSSLFTCTELKTLGDLDSMNENLKKGPGNDEDGIQVRVAVPLLVDFLNTSDDFIKIGNLSACMRFAHAETVAPFAALLQISKADKASHKPANLTTSWQSSAVIPLSANIQWIFYKGKGTGDYLVKVLLNEKEEKIDGLESATSPYYRWSDLRALYLSKLNKLNVKLLDDMDSYLTHLK